MSHLNWSRYYSNIITEHLAFYSPLALALVPCEWILLCPHSSYGSSSWLQYSHGKELEMDDAWTVYLYYIIMRASPIFVNDLLLGSPTTRILWRQICTWEQIESAQMRFGIDYMGLTHNILVAWIIVLAQVNHGDFLHVHLPQQASQSLFIAIMSRGRNDLVINMIQFWYYCFGIT